MLLTLLLIVLSIIHIVPTTSLRLVCYYDSKSHFRDGTAKMMSLDVVPSLNYCTHLIYGYADIDEKSSKLISANEYLDLESGKGYYQVFTNFKGRFPGLHVILSVGGPGSNMEKYLKMLENEEERLDFVESVYDLIKKYKFDGFDLAWKFPETEVVEDRGTFGTWWYKIKKKFGYVEVYEDKKEEEHRHGFTELVKELGYALQGEGLLLSMTVLPNTRTTYYDVEEIGQHLDIVNLLTFDFKTPERNPDKADYPAPLYTPRERNPDDSIDGAVQWWLVNGMPDKKITIGIPTYGQAWKLTEDSSDTGIPPIEADDAGMTGASRISGVVSQPEICRMTVLNQANHTDKILKRVVDPYHELGTYAYRLPSSDDGLWVAYDDQDTVARKAKYAKENSLGGVAIYDISLEDFRGVCSEKPYPLVRAARNNL